MPELIESIFEDAALTWFEELVPPARCYRGARGAHAMPKRHAPKN